MLLFPRQYLLGLALTATAAAAQAQQTLPPPPPLVATAPAAPTALLPPAQVDGKYHEYLKARYAADPTALAVDRLYSRRQTGGVLWLLTGAGVISFVASQTGTKTTSSGTTTLTVTPVGYAVLLGLFGGVGLHKVSRFGNFRLYQVLSEYDQTHTLPGYVASRID